MIRIYIYQTHRSCLQNENISLKYNNKSILLYIRNVFVQRLINNVDIKLYIYILLHTRGIYLYQIYCKDTGNYITSRVSVYSQCTSECRSAFVSRCASPVIRHMCLHVRLTSSENILYRLAKCRHHLFQVI